MQQGKSATFFLPVRRRNKLTFAESWGFSRDGADANATWWIVVRGSCIQNLGLTTAIVNDVGGFLSLVRFLPLCPITTSTIHQDFL
jgi:hypothetical protein